MSATTAASHGAPRALGGSYSVWRIAGIDIRMHFTFLVFLAWVVLSHLVEGQGAAACGRIRQSIAPAE